MTFVTGPPTPPRGIGSLRLQTNLGKGDGSAQMRSARYAGVLLTNLTELTYYAYSATNNGQQFPYLSLAVTCSTCAGGAVAQQFSLISTRRPTRDVSDHALTQ
jgi:hypothetical protein